MSLERLLPIVLLSLLAMPSCNLFESDREKWKSTLHSSREIVRALETIRDEKGHYPISEEIDVAALDSPHLHGLMNLDAWDRPYRYMSSGDSFLLWSLGSNGEVDRYMRGGPSDDYTADIVWWDGAIWQTPGSL